MRPPESASKNWMAKSKNEAMGTPSLSATQLSSLFGVSEVTIYDLCKREVLVNNNGRFDLVNSVRSYIAYIKSGASVRGNAKGALDYNAEKARLTKAQADLAEVNLAKAQGKVIEVEQVEINLANVFAEVRANMRNIPARVSSHLVGESDERVIRKRLLEEVDLVLEAIADTDVVIRESSEEGARAAENGDDSEDDGEV